MKIGYTRISARTQNLARQLATMKERGIEERFLFRDVASGKNFDRPGYIAMKSILREGDCLYVDALDRLGRDYDSIIREWKEITRDMGCDIVALDNEALFDSRKFKEMGDLGRMLEDQLLAVLAYVADVERKKTLERQKQGIAAAKTAGVPPPDGGWSLVLPAGEAPSPRCACCPPRRYTRCPQAARRGWVPLPPSPPHQ